MKRVLTGLFAGVLAAAMAVPCMAFADEGDTVRVVRRSFEDGAVSMTVLEVSDVVNGANSGSSSDAWKRLYGDSAFGTMSTAVRAGDYEKGGVVLLATSEGYWDALTASGLAGLYDAPVLMTEKDRLTGETRALLSELDPSAVIVCGGPEAVSSQVAGEAAAVSSAALVRVAGDFASDTSREAFLIGQTYTKGRTAEWSRAGFVCTGQSYHDALAVAAVAYALHMPVFLTEGSTDISLATLDAMGKNVDKVYIVGGRDAVSPAVASKIRSRGIEVAARLADETAIGTSEEVARFGISQGLSADRVGIATVSGYWDALTGAPLCGKNGSVLVLVDDKRSSSIYRFVKDYADSINTGYVFGGPSAISDEVVGALQAALLHPTSPLMSSTL